MLVKRLSYFGLMAMAVGALSPPPVNGEPVKTAPALVKALTEAALLLLA